LSVNVTLQKSNGRVIEQGFTDSNGELSIFGAESSAWVWARIARSDGMFVR